MADCSFLLIASQSHVAKFASYYSADWLMLTIVWLSRFTLLPSSWDCTTWQLVTNEIWVCLYRGRARPLVCQLRPPENYHHKSASNQYNSSIILWHNRGETSIPAQGQHERSIFSLLPFILQFITLLLIFVSHSLLSKTYREVVTKARTYWCTVVDSKKNWSELKRMSNWPWGLFTSVKQDCLKPLDIRINRF